MATDSSRFLAVSADAPNINTGWQIRVLDYKDMTTPVAYCNEFDSFSFTQELNAPGLGSISVDTDSPWWNTRLNNGLTARSLLSNEYVLEAWEGGVARFAWLAQTVEETIVGEDETHKTTISGPGIAQVLTWACIQRPGWPKTPPVVDHDKKGTPIRRSFAYLDTMPAYLWQFPMKWTSMHMWTNVFLAAQRRGLLKCVKPQFSGVLDSERKKWQYVRTIQTIEDNHGYQPEEPNENLLDFLNDCTGQDYSKWFGQRLEWIMEPGFKLKVMTRIGGNRTRTVRFFTGQILSNQRTRDRESIFNRVTAVDAEGGESVRTDKDSVKTWNLREQRNETHKNVTDPALRNQLADRLLLQTKDEKSQWSIKIPYDDPGRVPFHHFFVGDTIMLSNGTAGLMEYRVKAISLSFTADATMPDVELTLQSIIDSKLEEVQKQITKLINNPRNVSLHDIKEIAIPDAPKVKSGLTYDPKTKKWVATPITEFGTDGGVKVFVQTTDPALTSGNDVKPGDFWYDTDA